MSAPIKFYFHLISQPSRALYIFLKQTKIPTEFYPVDLRSGEQKTDLFRDNVNRLGKVPAIIDNGFQLSESSAIFRYLVGRYKVDDNWYPENRHERARIDEYLEWHHLNTRLYGLQYFWTYFMKPRGVTEIPKLAKTTEPVDVYLDDILDEIENLWLKPGCFISGTNQVSFADVLAACELEQLTLSGCDPSKNRPNVSEWFKYVRHLNNPAYYHANVVLNKLKQRDETIIRLS